MIAVSSVMVSNFYPRSPCGERPIIFCKLLDRFIISIHALLAESDPSWATRARAAQQFLSTLSLRRATSGCLLTMDTPNIFLSTLSLRRATATHQRLCAQRRYFYPRSPCGERLNTSFALSALGDFYPRSPCGERLNSS